MVKTGSGTLVRRINRNVVMTLIREHSPISQADIVNATGLGKATVSSIVADLSEDGWISDAGEESAVGDRGGRPATLLKMNPDRGFVVGVKILETAMALVVTDLDARVVHHETVSLEAGDQGYSANELLTTTTTLINAAIDTAGVEKTKVLGVGVGVTGLVDGDNGVGIFSRVFPDDQGLPIAKLLSEALDLPVYVENDVNTLAVAERWFGVGQDCDNFAVVTIGRGIGAGLIVHGKLVRGIRGGAGEFGHLCVQPGGPLCECGNRGCLQAVAADPAVVANTQAELDAGRASSIRAKSVTIDEINSAADAGDDLAREMLAESGAAFGHGLALLINILAPEKIIVSGEGIGSGPWRVEPMLTAIRGEAFEQIAEAVDIQVERLGFESWARGAACVVLGKLFDSPVNEE